MNEDFRYIAAIAEYGSISRAARELHLSQPGLSQRLRRVEGRLGCELFDRDSSPLVPTAPGEVYVRYALRALAAEDSMRREVRDAASGGCRRLRIGVSMSRADALLSGPLAEFHDVCRGCEVELLEMTTLEQMHELFVGKGVNAAVLTPIAPDPTFYDAELLCHEQLVVAAACDLAAPQLARSEQGRISMAQLEGLPLALPACGGYYDPLINQLIDISRAQLDVIVRGCGTGLALSLVQEGLAVAIVPSTSLMGRPGLQSFELDAAAGNALRYIRRRDSAVTSDEEALLDILRRHLRDLASAAASADGLSRSPP